MITVFILVFAWNLLRLKTEPSVQYQMFIPLSKPLNTSNSIRKHNTEKNGGQNTSLLNPICDGKGYGAFSIVLYPCMHAVMKLYNDGDEFLVGSRILPWFSKGHPCWPCHMPWSDQHKWSRGQCSVPDTSLAANTTSTVSCSLQKPH